MTAALVAATAVIEAVEAVVLDGRAADDVVIFTLVVLAVVRTAVVVDFDVDVMDLVVLLRGHVPAARSVRLVGVGVFGTLVFGPVPTVMVALP